MVIWRHFLAILHFLLTTSNTVKQLPHPSKGLGIPVPTSTWTETRHWWWWAWLTTLPYPRHSLINTDTNLWSLSFLITVQCLTTNTHPHLLLSTALHTAESRALPHPTPSIVRLKKIRKQEEKWKEKEEVCVGGGRRKERKKNALYYFD